MIKISIAPIDCFQMCSQVTVNKAHYPVKNSNSQTYTSLQGQISQQCQKNGAQQMKWFYIGDKAL
jgi:hypothetical protein